MRHADTIFSRERNHFSIFWQMNAVLSVHFTENLWQTHKILILQWVIYYTTKTLVVSCCWYCTTTYFLWRTPSNFLNVEVISKIFFKTTFCVIICSSSFIDLHQSCRHEKYMYYSNPKWMSSIYWHVNPSMRWPIKDKR